MRRSCFSLFILFTAFSLFSAAIAGDKGDESNKRLNKTNTNDHNQYIAVNQIFMWVSNNGMGSHDPRTDGSGFYWPGGENAIISAIYEDGLIWGAKVGREIRVNGSVYRHGLQAGKILADGTADNPNLEKYRVYKIRKGWESLPPGPERDAYEKDYKEWPIEDGAPYILDKNGNKVPQFVGDEVLWCVSNDLDEVRTTYTYGTLPMGLEQQMTVFGFDNLDDRGDMVFKKYKIINKGELTLEEMYLGYWSDPDLGDAGDDYSGCDTILKLGYTYNADDNDESFYGSAPPAVGYVFLQGPIVSATENDSAKFLNNWRIGYKNLPMTAFFTFLKMYPGYSDPPQGNLSGSVQFYNNMLGKTSDGFSIVDPHTGLETTTMLAGDPVAGTGWYEGPDGWGSTSYPKGDRRHLMSSGPFTMAPGDTQEVVIGFVIGRGTSNLNSITELKRKTKTVQAAYDNDFNLTRTPDPPKVSSFSDDGEITLYWEPNSESYDVIDPLIIGKGKSDTTYTFEGYRIWQFSDREGSNKTLLGMVDLQNDVIKVTQPDEINGVKVEQTVFTLPNIGLKRFFTTRKDGITKTSLLDNGSPYYYAITAFAYSKESDPKYLESEPQIIEVRPAAQPIDITFDYNNGDFIPAKQTEGISDADVNLFVVNPLALTGDTYKIVFNNDSLIIRNYDNTRDSLVRLTYSLINTSKTPVDTILNHRTDLGKDSITNKLVTEGFAIVARNTGSDSILAGKTMKHRVKSIQEIKGPGGKVLDTPVDVFNGKLNSTKTWTIYPRSSAARLNWQSILSEQSMGYENYEIRFDDSSSYFLSGLQNGLSEKAIMIKTDSLCKTGKLPFTVWSLGRYDNPTDAKRLFLKVVDRNIGVNDSTKAI
ncbi:MAG: hypothetical protein Q8K40_07860, partial [Ignavibacteria bacterium]|nr:hypothetical protein [Ignavibacteria bacterium]